MQPSPVSWEAWAGFTVVTLAVVGALRFLLRPLVSYLLRVELATEIKALNENTVATDRSAEATARLASAVERLDKHLDRGEREERRRFDWLSQRMAHVEGHLNIIPPVFPALPDEHD